MMKSAAALAAAALLAGCASLPGPAPAPAPPVLQAPAAWQAPLPAEAPPGAVPSLDDPALLPLVEAAIAASPGLSQARARVEQARAARVAAAAGLQPRLDAGASASRGRSDPSQPATGIASASLDAGWELDLWGSLRAGRDAASARLDIAHAAMQAARLSVALEVAQTLVELRACEAQAGLSAQDAASRSETARLTEVAERAGLRAPSEAALARASAAQARNALAERRAQCELLVKSLVELSALDEAALRERLAAAQGRLPGGTFVHVGVLPAQLIQQRADVLIASRNLAAAAADTLQADAARWPRVSLSGAIGGMRVSATGGTLSGSTWSLGPLAVTLPLFDGGRRAADLAAARAAYDDAVVQLQASVRTAVREVEQALVRLDSTARRRDDARIAAEDFDASLRAAEARWRGGLGSLFELEDARRSALAARSTLIDLERERLAAWIALYRALGGGFDATAVDSAAAATPTP